MVIVDGDDGGVQVLDVAGSEHMIFCSTNRTLRFEKSDGKNIRFNLCRLKCAFTLGFFADRQDKVVSLPTSGELVDISIPHRTSDGYYEFFLALSTAT